MNTVTNDSCDINRKEVVVIGNGPSAIILSYILSGNIPYWNGCPVSNDYLNIKLEQYVKDTPLLEQDLEFLSDGLEGRSRNPVSLLIDHLMHPDADLGAHLQSKIKWRHDSSARIDHLCLGRGGIGGVWNQLTSKQLKTVSMADWMELPNYSMSTFRQQRRSCRCRPSSTNTNVSTTDEEQLRRATYDEVRSYYITYVRRNHLLENFRNGTEVTSIERVCVDAPYYDELTEEIQTPEPLWEIRGYYEQTKKPFVLHAKYVVLATGIPQNTTRPLGFLGEQASQSFTHTRLNEIEKLIVQEKRLRNNSKPLLVVGCGLTAIDVLLLCQFYSIPVLHVFRRAIDDHELVLNQLPANLFPEYEHIRELIKQSTTSPSSSSYSQWSYRCCPQSEVVSISEDGTAHIRNLRNQVTMEYDISFVARLTGSDATIPFLSSSSTAKKKNGLPVNPYTYEYLDYENVYVLGPLAGDKLVRFLQGGALACAANLFKKHRQASSTNNNANSRLTFTVPPRVRSAA